MTAVKEFDGGTNRTEPIMAIPVRPAWSTLAREKLPAARAAEARQMARQRAAAERQLEKQTRAGTAGRGRHTAAGRG